MRSEKRNHESEGCNDLNVVAEVQDEVQRWLEYWWI